MGWFWADGSSQPAIPVNHPRVAASGATPPPSCPMHNASQPSASSRSTAPIACPVKHDAAPTNPSACPMKHDGATSPSPSYISKLNPLNYMPSNLSNTRDSSHQSIELSLDREASTIPRGDGAGNWEYPSPQQMYNAMLRKGYTDTPAEHVTSMVAVHNFLNEGAWEEIKGWEGRFSAGLLPGWGICNKGEENAPQQMALQRLRQGRRLAEGEEEPKLIRFMGRPNELTPKARMLSFMAKVWPSQFPENPPFDRHDWFVGRKNADGSTREVRYVIDYYSGPPEPTGEPVFYLDVRPALDGPTAACERMLRWSGDVWWRAKGGNIREELARQKARQ